MTDKTELLSCPFCGGEAELLESECGMFMTGYAVYCTGKCRVKMGVSGRLSEVYEWTPVFDTEAEAIEAWNTRAAVTDYDFAMAVHDGNLWRRIKDHIRCKYCGLNIESVIPLDGCNKNAIKHCPNCGKAVER